MSIIKLGDLIFNSEDFIKAYIENNNLFLELKDNNENDIFEYTYKFISLEFAKKSLIKLYRDLIEN